MMPAMLAVIASSGELLVVVGVLEKDSVFNVVVILNKEVILVEFSVKDRL